MQLVLIGGQVSTLSLLERAVLFGTLVGFACPADFPWPEIWDDLLSGGRQSAEVSWAVWQTALDVKRAALHIAGEPGKGCRRVADVLHGNKSHLFRLSDMLLLAVGKG